VFISDVIAELDAAHLASMHTLLCLRPGNPHAPPEPGHPTIHSFDELFPQSLCERANLSCGCNRLKLVWQKYVKKTERV
ncbi:MAG: hypothetical protein WCD76_14565, partial [Pyrinomonadaceae bacterium]